MDRTRAILIGAMVWLAPISAFAGERPVNVRLSTEDCIDAGALRASVEHLGGIFDEDAELRLLAHVTEHDSGVHVQVSAEGDSHVVPPRSFVVASCTEAREALALIAVIAARNEEGQLEPTSPPSVAVAAPAATVDHLPGNRRPPNGVARASLEAWAAPTFTTLGEGAFGARAGVGLRRRHALLASAEASIGATLPADVAGGGGRATLGWITARVGGSVVRFDLTPQASLSIDAFFEAGRLRAEGSSVDIVDEARVRTWLAAGSGARARWSTRSSWFVDAGVGVLVPLRRDSFFFRGAGTVYAVPIVAADAVLAVGRSFE